MWAGEMVLLSDRMRERGVRIGQGAWAGGPARPPQGDPRSREGREAYSCRPRHLLLLEHSVTGFRRMD